MSTPQNPMIGMMGDAQTAMQNPMASTVPQPGGFDLSNHPIVQAILKAVQQGAGAYGWTSMPPQQRLEAQNLAQQKAEAMARLGLAGQQLGLEGQRVGLEGERVGIERSRAEQEKAYQTGQLGIRGREAATGEAAQRTSQQRADQEHQDRVAQHELASKQLEQTIRYQTAETQTAQGRLAVERRANELTGQRIDMEKQHFESSVAMQGKQYTRQLAEDERKQLHTSLDSYYKEHPWIANLTGTGAGSLQQKHKDIDDYIDKKIAVPGAYSGWKPSQGVLAQPGQTTGPQTAADWLASKGVKPQ